MTYIYIYIYIPAVNILLTLILLENGLIGQMSSIYTCMSKKGENHWYRNQVILSSTFSARAA